MLRKQETCHGIGLCFLCSWMHFLFVHMDKWCLRVGLQTFHEKSHHPVCYLYNIQLLQRCVKGQFDAAMPSEALPGCSHS